MKINKFKINPGDLVEILDITEKIEALGMLALPQDREYGNILLVDECHPSFVVAITHAGRQYWVRRENVRLVSQGENE